MRRAFLVSIILAMLILPAGKALGATVLWQAWIYETDDQTITLAWDAVEGAETYDIKTISKYPPQEWVVSVTGTTATVARPRVGLFRFAVRACNSAADPVCSDWAYSDGPTAAVTLADGQMNRPWGVFWRLSSVIIR